MSVHVVVRFNPVHYGRILTEAAGNFGANQSVRAFNLVGDLLLRLLDPRQED